MGSRLQVPLLLSYHVEFAPLSCRRCVPPLLSYCVCCILPIECEYCVCYAYTLAQHHRRPKTPTITSTQRTQYSLASGLKQCTGLALVGAP
ncbi:hypothetical protein BC834DRAFT_173313 [Gloeopeniophorella convolvens]|nr:hypothetical protein BC834DRAFT_173313 [Gloeopeniophorella convolvens]